MIIIMLKNLSCTWFSGLLLRAVDAKFHNACADIKNFNSYMEKFLFFFLQKNKQQNWKVKLQTGGSSLVNMFIAVITQYVWSIQLSSTMKSV